MLLINAVTYEMDVSLVLIGAGATINHPSLSLTSNNAQSNPLAEFSYGKSTERMMGSNKTVLLWPSSSEAVAAWPEFGPDSPAGAAVEPAQKFRLSHVSAQTWL